MKEQNIIINTVESTEYLEDLHEDKEERYNSIYTLCHPDSHCGICLRKLNSVIILMKENGYYISRVSQSSVPKSIKNVDDIFAPTLFSISVKNTNRTEPAKNIFSKPTYLTVNILEYDYTDGVRKAIVYAAEMWPELKNFLSTHKDGISFE